MEIIPSESFWRKKDRLGRKLIDKHNNTLKHHLPRSIQSKNTSMLFNMIHDQLENPLLIKKIQLIEEEMNTRDKIIDKNNQDIQSLQKKLADLRKEKSTLKEQIHRQNQLLLQMYNFSYTKNSNKVSKLIETALKDIFSQPDSFVQRLEENQEVQKPKDKISHIFKSKLK